MIASIKDLIRKRKSVRTYNGEALHPEDRQKLNDYLQTASNSLFDIPVEFRFLGAKQYGLSSPVIVGCDEYVAAKVARGPLSETAFGYSFEAFCLYALSLGIGTVILAGTLNRSAFERAMEVQENEVMPAASPIGYPAQKPSMRETLMRKGIKADERLPFDALFFENTFSQPLTPEKAGIFRDALEMTRLAPSAVNRQPWRAVVCGNTVHFFEKRAKSLQGNSLGDIQQIDMGIALAHFDLTLKESGINGQFVVKDFGLSTDGPKQYIISYEVKP